jgi:hypothetical protein
MDNVTGSRGAARCLNGVMGRDGGRWSDSCARCLGEEIEPACIRVVSATALGRRGEGWLTDPDIGLKGPRKLMSRYDMDGQHHQTRL